MNNKGIDRELISDDDRCQECGEPLPDKKMEVRDNGYYEWVTECRGCGAVYTD